MKNQIIIHAAGKQTRIALLENGELAQLFIESPENQRTVGDIYLAEVRKVMGGIRAGFIDMNTPKDAFLHYSDLGEHLDSYLVMLNGQNAIPKDALAKLQEYRKNKDQAATSKNGTNAEEQNLLGSLLKPGHKVLVQIVKEPIGSKGPRVSTNISIAGRFLVLIPMGDYVAVSKRIKSYKERRVLRQTVADILPEGFGVIVRTVAEGQDPKMIHDDLMDVLEKWNNITKNLETAKPPSLLHRDLEMTESLVRDLFAKDFERILVDDPKMFKSLKQYVSKIAPNMLPNIHLYKGSEHVFDHMRIMQDVESVFSPRVKMPSGGYLIFEQTEAMYVVDVNSGRYAAKKAQEDNSLKTNLEAAREIAKQLRLRDIGGIIVVDFIDLRDDVNRKKVYDELKKEFRKDRAKTNLLPMSDFGLIQITRQRIRPSVVTSVSRVCPMCGGSGSIVSQNTILSDIEGWLQKFKLTTKYRSADLHINPYMKGMLTKGWISQHFKWMLKYRLRIGLIEDQSLSMNDYKFTLSGSDVDITETIVMDQSIEQAIKAAEQRIAEMESEIKRDSTTLDIYVKESKPQSKQTEQRTPPRQQPSSRPAPESQQSRPQQQSSRPPERNERQQERPQPKPAPKPTPAADEVQPAKDGQRRNDKISKYYKKPEEGEEQQKASVEATPKEASKPADTKPAQDQKSVEQSKSTTEPDTTVVKSADQDTEIPENLAHLRSAWEVAKEYKIKREKELSGKTESSESSDKPESEESVKAASSDQPSVKETNVVAESAVEAPAKTPKAKTAKEESELESKSEESGTPEKVAAKDIVEEPATDASAIIQGLVKATSQKAAATEKEKSKAKKAPSTKGKAVKPKAKAARPAKKTAKKDEKPAETNETKNPDVSESTETIDNN